MLHIALLCGGKSPEHEISLRSAKNILSALDRGKYSVTVIGVDRSGCWRLQADNALGDEISAEGPLLALVPGVSKGRLIRVDNGQALPEIDTVFPIIHGPNGEDGSLQGLLRSLNLPFVGPGVLGSAAAMDKDVAKRLLREAGLKVAEFLCFHTHEQDAIDFQAVVNQLGSPVYVKPANMGSSVGVHRVATAEAFAAAIKDAFSYDRKVIVEEQIVGRELECAVLGNALPEVTHVGEVVAGEGYDYDSKYASTSSALILIPADVEDAAMFQLQVVAKQAYQVLGCEGMSRVDMFLTREQDVYVNEINTLPGFTNISMYPKLWAHAGTAYAELIDELIRLAIDRHREQDALKTSWK